MTIRTRFAPSPTGRLHLGNVRTAVFNWLLARRYGGSFVLRIEDTDPSRNVPGAEDAILEDLRWLGLDWEEGPDRGGPHGPYRQSARGGRHIEAAKALIAADAAYPCFCAAEPAVGEGDGEARRYSGACRRLGSDERRDRVAAGEPHVVRFAVPAGLGDVEIVDEIFGVISFPSKDIDDFVVLRSDGRATYNFGVVVDDRDMRISHVVRGVGHLSNTPKQALIFDALGASRPVFAHLPQVLGAGGRKLAKREGATPVSELREAGYPADAVLNYLSLLGWSHPDEREVLTRDELVDAIDLRRVGRSDTQLDPDKLRWVSAQHIAAEPLGVLTDHVRPHVDPERHPAAVERLEAVVDALRTRLTTYGELVEHLPVLFPAPDARAHSIAALRADGRAREVVRAVRDALLGVELPWDGEALGRAVRDAGKGAGVRGADLFHPTRAALIASEQGPDLGKILAALGREEALRRLNEVTSGGPAPTP